MKSELKRDIPVNNCTDFENGRLKSAKDSLAERIKLVVQLVTLVKLIVEVIAIVT